MTMEAVYERCECPLCGNFIEYPPDSAGATVDCPHCRQPIQLPGPAFGEASPPPASPVLDILARLGSRVPGSPLSLFYQAGLLLTAGLMVLLPCLYVLMILGIGLGLYYYAVNFTFLLASVSGGLQVYLLKAALYFGPLAGGAMAVLFMIKPLFARPARGAQPLAINPGAEPMLYSFISKICQSVGAPQPRRIEIDCQLNASASLAPGLGGIVGGSLILTIGLPLVAGLTLQEFGGVVAHEFGHFTQGFAMRLRSLIGRVNRWFARVVYGRDDWDLWLAEAQAGESSTFTSFLFTCMEWAVKLSRLVLRLLMHLGRAASCFLSRQMEFDADHYQIQVAGSGAFESASQRITLLHCLLQPAYQNLEQIYRTKGRLAPNFPEYLLQIAATVPEAGRLQLENYIGLQPTRWFDTHPSEAERIRRSRRGAQPGCFASDLPATVLFSNFDVLARQVTALHYQDDLGLKVNLAAAV